MSNRREQAQVTQAPHSPGYKWWVLIIGAGGLFVVTQDAAIVNLALPELSAVFNVKAGLIVWVSAAHLLGGTALMPTVGRLGDYVSQRLIFTLGFLVFGLGLALSSSAPNLGVLIAFRLIQGMGASMILANGRGLVASIFPPQERGKALGMVAAGVSLGLATGPLIGGFLVDTLGWRSVFYARIPIVLAWALLAFLVIKDQKREEKKFQLDILGAVVLTVAVACFLVAVNQGRLSTLFIVTGLGFLVSFPLFLLIESRVASPILDLKLFAIPFFGSGVLNLALLFMTIAAINLLIPFFLIKSLGVSATITGQLMMTAPLARIVMEIPSGWISDKIGVRPLIVTGLAMMVLGFLLMTRLDQGTGLRPVILWLMIIGGGQGMFDATNSSAVLGSVPRQRIGTASAMYGTSVQLGLAAGFAAFGAIFDARQDVHRAALAQAGLSGELSLIHI